MMHLESITTRNKVRISPPFPEEEEEEEDTRCKFAPLEVARADNRIIFRQLQADRRRRRRRRRGGDGGGVICHHLFFITATP